MFESVIERYLKEFTERLTKIEEAQKKNFLTEDEERRNEEEKAKAAFKRNKEFESFTKSFKEDGAYAKALQKTQGVDDYHATMGGITKEVALQLPPNFTIPEADRFARVGDPKQHLRQYLNFVKIKGLNEQQVLKAFPLSLARSASNWYYTLNVGQTKN
jgi:hypothetical protein